MFNKIPKRPQFWFGRKPKVTGSFIPLVLKYDGLGYSEPQLDPLKKNAYYKNKEFIDEMKEKREVMNSKLTELNTQRQERYHFLANMENIVENLKFNVEQGSISNPAFKHEMEAQNSQIQFTNEELQDQFKYLYNSLNCLTDYELLQFQKHSVSLQLSKNMASQAKGLIMKSALDEIIKKNTEKLITQDQQVKELTEKVALMIVYKKLDSIFNKKNTEDGIGEFENQQLMFLLNDPFLKPNSSRIRALIKSFYPQSEINILNDIDMTKEEDIIESHIQRNYFEARIKILCDFVGISYFQNISVQKTDLEKQYKDLLQQIESKKGIENSKQNDEQLVVQLGEILGNYKVQQSLDGKIKKLQASTNTFRKDIPSLEKISQILETILYNLPKDLKEKYFHDEKFKNFSPNYMNKNYSENELQWKVVDLEIPSDILPVKEYKEQIKERKMVHKMNNLYIYNYEAQHSHDFEYMKDDNEVKFYENSDIQVDPKITDQLKEARMSTIHIQQRNKALIQINDFIFQNNQHILNSSQTKKDDHKVLKLKRHFITKEEAFDLIELNQDIERTLWNKKYVFTHDDPNDKNDENQDDLITIGTNKEENYLVKNKPEVLKLYFKGDYANQQLSPSQQKAKNILGKNVFGTKMNDVVKFYKGTFQLGPLNHKNRNNYLLNEESKDQEDNLLAYDHSVTQPKFYSEPDYTVFYNQWIEKQYSYKKRNVPIESKDSSLFDFHGENKSDGQTGIVQKTAIEIYKEFNKNDFYKHYIQNAIRDMRQYDYYNNKDYLNANDDPNFGLYRTEQKLSQYSQNYLQTNNPYKLPSPKLNAVKPNTELSMEEFKKQYPKLFEDEKQNQESTLQKVYRCSGSRKKARASVFLKVPGTGKVTVNQRDFIEYFQLDHLRVIALFGIIGINKACQIDIDFFARGGGLKSQAEACKVSLGKALIKAFPDYSPIIKGLKVDFSDKRQKECKKINSYGARKSYTYVRR